MNYSRVTQMMRGLFVCALIANSAWAEDSKVKTYIRFVDSCTHDTTAITTPNGEKVEVEILGVDRNIPVWVDFRMGPPDLMDGTANPRMFRKTKLIHPDYDSKQGLGYIKLNKKVKIKLPKDKMVDDPVRKLWRARILWTQVDKKSSVAKSGSAEAYMYVTDAKSDRFYRSVGTPVCHWETPAQIQSDYRFNSTGSVMELAKTLQWTEVWGQKTQYALGFLPNRSFGGVNFTPGSAASPTPMMGTPMAPFGTTAWFFKDWRKITALGAYTNVTRRWLVDQNQGGYFGVKYRFVRLPVEEVALEEGGIRGCDRWKVTRIGFLDVGMPDLDFYIVPQSLSGDPIKSAGFIEKMNPTANTCSQLEAMKDFPYGGSEFKVPETGEGITYFYPQEINY